MGIWRCLDAWTSTTVLALPTVVPEVLAADDEASCCDMGEDPPAEQLYCIFRGRDSKLREATEISCNIRDDIRSFHQAERSETAKAFQFFYISKGAPPYPWRTFNSEIHGLGPPTTGSNVGCSLLARRAGHETLHRVRSCHHGVGWDLWQLHSSNVALGPGTIGYVTWSQAMLLKQHHVWAAHPTAEAPSGLTRAVCVHRLATPSTMRPEKIIVGLAHLANSAVTLFTRKPWTWGLNGRDVAAPLLPTNDFRKIGEALLFRCSHISMHRLPKMDYCLYVLNAPPQVLIWCLPSWASWAAPRIHCSCSWLLAEVLAGSVEGYGCLGGKRAQRVHSAWQRMTMVCRWVLVSASLYSASAFLLR